MLREVAKTVSSFLFLDAERDMVSILEPKEVMEVMGKVVARVAMMDNWRPRLVRERLA